jgi:hypothetical protein
MLGISKLAAFLTSAAILPVLATTAPPSETRTATDALRIEGPYTHQNLSIYVVSGPTEDSRRFITLAEGLKNKSVKLRERGAGVNASVNELEIENASDDWLYLQAGDVIIGGQQDRTIAIDVAIAPRSKPQPIAAFCVEHGRWTPRERTGGAAAFSFRESNAIAGSNAMKMSIQEKADQSRVWAEVARDEKRASAKVAAPVGASTGTYDAIVSNKAIAASRADYVGTLLGPVDKAKDAVGIVVAIDGKIQSADVYGSSALFRKLARKLLESYAQEAILSPASGAKDSAAVPTVDEARSFLRASAAGSREKSENVAKSTTRTTIRQQKTVVFEYTSRETEAGQKTLLHRNYVRE